MAAEVSVGWEQALAWRLGRQLLDPVGTLPAAEVVRRLGAVPAQDRVLAGLALGVRRPAGEPDGLAEALAEGTVVRAFAFRGAIHHLSAAEGGTWLALRAAGRQWERRSWVEHYGLAPEDWPGFRGAVREALLDGPLTVPELGEALARHRDLRHLRPFLAEGGVTLVKPLSWQGDLVVGEPREGRLTLRGVHDNPHWQGVPPLEEAGPRAVLSYVRGYGPVTDQALHHWLGEGLSAGRRRIQGWVAGLGDGLVTVDVDGTGALVAREDVDDLLAARPSSAVLMLPGHDQWVMGPGTADPHVTPPRLRELMTRKANPVVVGGVVRGTWAHRRAEGRLVVDWRDATTRPDVALRTEAARLAGRLGEDLDVVLEG